MSSSFIINDPATTAIYTLSLHDALPIFVYAIDQSTGEPKPIQHADTHKIHPRTFHIHPSARLLVAEHNLPVNVRDGDAVKTVAAGLSVFRMGEDGKLTFARTYDIDVGDKLMFWMGMVPLPASA